MTTCMQTVRAVDDEHPDRELTVTRALCRYSDSETNESVLRVSLPQIQRRGNGPAPLTLFLLYCVRYTRPESHSVLAGCQGRLGGLVTRIHGIPVHVL